MSTAQALFEWFEEGLKSPILIVNGCEAAVPRAARRHLVRLVREAAHPRQIRGALAEINKMAADQTKWRRAISPQCWTHSLLSDGQSAGTNEGNIPGTPPMVILGIGDLSEMLTKAGVPGMPSRPVLRQTVGYRGPATPLPPPSGDERLVPFSSGSASRSLGPTDGESHAMLTISGIEGQLAIRKNAETLEPLATVTLPVPGITRSTLNGMASRCPLRFR
jgi:hypothetical protein